MRFELDQDFECRCALSLLVFRKLCLTDSQYLAKFCLSEIEAPDLPDSPADGFEVRLVILLDHTRNNGISFFTVVKQAFLDCPIPLWHRSDGSASGINGTSSRD